MGYYIIIYSWYCCYISQNVLYKQINKHNKIMDSVETMNAAWKW